MPRVVELRHQYVVVGHVELDRPQRLDCRLVLAERVEAYPAVVVLVKYVR